MLRWVNAGGGCHGGMGAGAPEQEPVRGTVAVKASLEQSQFSCRAIAADGGGGGRCVR